MANPQNIVYFDLETQRTANDVGGWDKKSAMGISLGVTFSTASNCYEVFSEKRVSDLVDLLNLYKAVDQLGVEFPARHQPGRHGDHGQDGAQQDEGIGELEFSHGCHLLAQQAAAAVGDAAGDLADVHAAQDVAVGAAGSIVTAWLDV